MPGPGDLDALAHDVLDACVACLDTIPIEIPGLAGAPARTLVTPGIPVWDCCDQLAVHVAGVRDQSTRPQSPVGVTARRHVYGRLTLAEIQATVTRCVPTGDVVGTVYEPPTEASLEAAAEQIHADGWALYNGIYNRIAQGILSDRCSEVAWDGLQTAAPAGGCGGWTFVLRFQLGGYGYGDPIGS